MKHSALRRNSPALSRILGVWLAQHRDALVLSARQMAANSVGSLLTTAVIGVSLSLPAGFYLVLDNAQRITAGWRGGPQINLFLHHEVSDEQAATLALTLEAHEDLAEVRLIDRAAALQEYRENSGLDDALSVLDENPLPPVLLLQPADGVMETERGTALLTYLQSLDTVEAVQYDRHWANRLIAIIELFQRGVTILATLLAFAVLLIIGNTIRLAIYNRRTEIEINKLFGATDAFIQRPFLYTGLLHGFGGAVMAWLLLLVTIELLKTPAAHLSTLYLSDFHIRYMGLRETLLLLLAGALLGLSGSWIAVKRHIRRMGLS